jgi:hypothetical protein
VGVLRHFVVKYPFGIETANSDEVWVCQPANRLTLAFIVIARTSLAMTDLNGRDRRNPARPWT